MKRIFTICVCITLACLHYGAQAQVNVTVTPKVRNFPSSGVAYTENPLKYFNILVTNTSSQQQDVYFGFTIHCDYSASGKQFNLATPTDRPPMQPLTLSPGETKQITRADADRLFGHINGSELKLSGISWKEALLLPEGNYEICVTPYRWQQQVTNPIRAGEVQCCRFTICYSGSAPEFTSPLIGQGPGNLSNSNPLQNNYTKGFLERTVTTGNYTSNIRNSSQYTVLTPTRNLNFRWTGVISNCLSPNDFTYILKIVEIGESQNVQTAIKNNQVMAAVRTGTKLYYTHDTIANRHFRLQIGHSYAAVVEAVPRNSNITAQLGNNGVSQIIAFTWGESKTRANRSQPGRSKFKSESKDNRSEVLAQLRQPYMVNPGKDKKTIEKVRQQFSDEASYEPSSKKEYPFIENTFYKLPDTATLRFGWMPLRGDSVEHVKYVLELYEYAGGDVSLSYAGKPLMKKSFNRTRPNYPASYTTLIETDAESWKKSLKSGSQYVVRLLTTVDYNYAKTITVPNLSDTLGSSSGSRDSIVGMVGNTTFSSHIIFQWGIDSGALTKLLPPQFLFPVDLTDKDPEDTTWNKIEEVIKYKDFKFSWKGAKNVSALDTVRYHLLIAKLPKGKTREKAIKDTLLFYPNLLKTECKDSLFKDSLKIGEQYVAYIDISVTSPEKYLMVNKGRSQYATFKLVDEKHYAAKLDSLYQCHPDALKGKERKAAAPDVKDLIKNKTRLKIGQFPLVLQNATFCEKDSTYTGEGYIVWKPFHKGECWLKVRVDSIRINKNNEVIKGFAVSSTADTIDYLSSLDLGIDINNLSSNEQNRLTSQLKDEQEIKKLLEKYGKYSNQINGLAGPARGESVSTGVLSFPLRVSDDMMNESHYFMLAINNMYFSPTTSIMNLLGIFHSDEEKIYVPLVATNVCMHPEGFLKECGKGIYMFLAQNYDIDLTDGYKTRFRRATTLGVPKDGTFLLVDTGGFKEMNVQLEFEMGSELMAINPASGTPEKKPVYASITANFASWGDWYGKVNMDPFAIDGCETFSFYPAGKGIYYDHSQKRTPADVKFPAGYFGEKVMTAEEKKAEEEKVKKMSASEKEAYNKKKKEENEKLQGSKKEWTGFYWDLCEVFLSDDISNTFVDTSGHDKATKDSMVVYKYGINGTLTDSSHYYYPGTRIHFGTNGLIIDKNGFSAEIFARDILRAETDKGGGWKFSLDTVQLDFEKNKYKMGHVRGRFGVPLFKGDFNYDCAVAHDSLDFTIFVDDSILKLDLWAANVIFDSKSSHFLIHKTFKEKQTKFDLTMNGKINIDFNKLDLPVNFTLVKFEHMGMRNYNYQKAENKGVKTSGFEWDFGEWSWASPQKTMGGAASDGNGEVATGSFGGFSFSLKTMEPYTEMVDTKKMKIGIAIAGKIGFGGLGGEEKETFAIGAEAGFKIWGVVNLKKDFEVSNVGGEVDSIGLNTDLTVFHLKGKLYLFRNDATYGNGFSGKLAVTMMDKVTVDMEGGFGSSTSNGSKYNWWYFQGAAKFSGTGIPLGPINLTGLGGGFAYNMDSKSSLTSFDAKKLLNSTTQKSVGGNMIQSTGMAFKPSKGSWVAKAGVSLAMANENLLNADGYLTLRISKGHFSGIFLNVSAYAMTKFKKDVPAGDGNNNSNALLKAQGIIGYERTATYNYFRLSLGVSSDISLANIITGGSAVPNFVDKVTKSVSYGGAAITNATGISLPTDKDYKGSAKQGADSKNNNFFDVKMSLYVPIDLEVMNYKKDTVKNGTRKKKNTTDWYFSIGKPNADECVRFEMSSNLLDILTSKATFTMYLMTGNSFAYSLPPLDDEVQEFFFGKKDKGKDVQGMNENKVSNARKVSNANMISIKDGGGFVMGATFKAKMEYSFLLYVKIMASLGFDVALLDVGNSGCAGYSQIGKNNFYAMGRVYAMLAGSVGLRLNLGFWKGDIELLKAGIGALLEGGAPNPTWAYGLLKLKVSLLNGLCKISTSVDFKAGDVCIPGADDPLANVKLFQNVSPAFTYADANKEANIVSPFARGAIVSNMPWDEDVVLVEGQEKDAKARRFRFVLWTPDISYQIYEGSAWKNQKMEFERSTRDENVYYFEHEDGGFPASRWNKVRLKARAFEWRTYNSKLTNAKTDFPYNLTTFKKKTTHSQYNCDWYDPEFNDGQTSKNAKRYSKAYSADTTFYFVTEAKPSTLKGQVVYTWPYNGDCIFPLNEFPTAHCSKDGKSHPTAYIYLNNKRPDLLNQNELKKQGKELRVFLVKQGGEISQTGTECNFDYVESGSLPRIRVFLPSSIKSGYDYKIKMIMVNSEEYKKNKQAALAENSMSNQQASVKYKNELKKRNLDQEKQKYIDDRSTTVKKKKDGKWYTEKKTYQLSDVEKKQFQAMTDYKNTYGSKDTAMLYKRAQLNEFKLCNQSGTAIYTLYFHTVSGNYRDMISQNASKLNSWLTAYPSSAVVSTEVITTRTDVSQSCPISMNKFMTLFVPYETDDPEMYANGIVLPPIAYFCIDRQKSATTDLMLYRHKVLTGDFVKMSNAFKNTRRECSFYGEKSPSNSLRTWKDNSGVNATAAQNVLSAGFKKSSDKFKAIDYRRPVSSGAYSYQPASYFPECSFDSYGNVKDWSAPSIITLYTNGTIPRVDEVRFSSSTYDNRNWASTFYWEDHAIPAICDDVDKLFNFFQECNRYARWFTGRGYSHKWDYLRYYQKNGNYDKCFTVDGFPYKVPFLYIPTHFFQMSNKMVYCYYVSSYKLGKSYSFPSEVSQYGYYIKDYAWGRYWWHFNNFKYSTNDGIATAIYDDKSSKSYRSDWYDMNGTLHPKSYVFDYTYSPGFLRYVYLDILYTSFDEKAYPDRYYIFMPEDHLGSIAKMVSRKEADALNFRFTHMYDANYLWYYKISQKYFQTILISEMLRLYDRSSDYSF